MNKPSSKAPTPPLDWDAAVDYESEQIFANGRPKLTVGLALSGGGIRSATFNLGILQHLKSLGFLNNLHFLSTVSGGGYIGAWLSANVKRRSGWLSANAEWEESIQHLRRFSNYLSPKVGFISADTWTMGMVWFRNTLLIQTTVLLAIALALLVPRLVGFLFRDWVGYVHWWFLALIPAVFAFSGIAANLLGIGDRESWLIKPENWLRTTLLAGACTALAAAAFWYDSGGSEALGLPRAFLQKLSIALPLVAAGFFFAPGFAKLVKASRLEYGQPWTQGGVVLPLFATAPMIAASMFGLASDPDFQQPTFSALLLHAYERWMFPLAFCLATFALLSLCSVDFAKKPRRLTIVLLAAPVSTLVLYAILCGVQCLLAWLKPLEGGQFHSLILIPALILFSLSLGAVVMIGMLGRQSSEAHREWWSRLGAWLAVYGAGWLTVSLAAFYGPWLAGRIADLDIAWSAALTWAATTAAGLFAGNSDSTSGAKSSSAREAALEAAAKLGPFVFIAGVLVLVSTGLHMLLFSLSDHTSFAPLAARTYWENFTLMEPSPAAVLSIGVLILLALFAWRVDINEFSLNSFYRSRLVRCYLGATRDPTTRNPQHFTGFDHDDDLPLAADSELKLPFHIVNGALNLGGSGDLDVQTRQSASFTFTPLHCGAQRVALGGSRQHVGYWPTQGYGDSDGMTLGQAISVSGAAASPNMGVHTSPAVAFLLTLFNVRLGWWFPNPSGTSPSSNSPNFSLFYLLKELFGSAGEDSDFLMISDGGHFENLGVYELVRRKCDFIIAGDAECDPDLTFGSLGNVIRMCEIDFGARIDIDVESIRRHPKTGLSLRHWAVGTIHYKNGKRPGTLVYLKSSLTGDEDTSVRQYKSAHPAFPHETTGDQFFSEDQFESYRRLGKHIAQNAFEHVGLANSLKETGTDV